MNRLYDKILYYINTVLSENRIYDDFVKVQA